MRELRNRVRNAGEPRAAATTTPRSTALGHHNVYNGESEAEKLRKQLERVTKEKEWAAQQSLVDERRRKKAEAALASAKKRAAAGVCPCCHRTVSQMARHIATKHPDYKPEEPA